MECLIKNKNNNGYRIITIYIEAWSVKSETLLKRLQ